MCNFGIATLILAAAAPSFDCAKASRADEKVVCAAPDLAFLDRLVAEAYAAALARAPKKAAEIRKEQRKWVAARPECFEERDGERPDTQTSSACLRREYGRRLSDLAEIEPASAAPVLTRTRKWSDGKRHVKVDVSYPALAQGAPGAAAFNSFFERKATAFEERARNLATDADVVENAKHGGMPSSLSVSFSVALTTPRAVMVVLRGYEYPTGAAHGLPFQESVIFDLQLGRPLLEKDVFVPGGKDRALALVARAVHGYAEVEPEDLPATVAKAVGDLSAWTFRREAVVVTFPVYSITGYGGGFTPVWLSYDELGPMLRPDTVLPPR
jgi:uncharacterized protein